VRGSKFRGRQHTALFRFVSKWVRLEKGLILGCLAAGTGVAAFAWSAVHLVQPLSPEGYLSIRFDDVATKVALLGVALFLGGLQVLFTSLFLGLFGIRVAEDEPAAGDRTISDP
jgi:hypothetical protein